MIKTIQENTLLILVVLLAIALRFSYIDYAPPALNWDEISHGYNAYSILKTGKDEWGEVFPTIFRAYGDYKLPVYIYITVLSEAIFGLTGFAVRLPSLLAGVATVIFTYLLANKLFTKKIAIVSSFLVALEPWSLFLSRGAFEANFSLALVVSGIYFLVLSLENGKFLFLSGVLLGLSVWTYNSARIFVPLLLLALVFIYKSEFDSIWQKQKKIIAFSLFLIVLFFAPMLYQLAGSVGQARYEKVAILDEGAVAKINEVRLRSGLPLPINRLINNRVTYFAKEFGNNYLSYFSPEFLFLKGGTNFQFSVPNHSLLYLIDLPFLLIGFFYLLRSLSKSSLVVLSWLVLAPIAGSLTREAPHVLRAIVMLPAPMLITALGVVTVWQTVGKNLKTVFILGYVALVVASAENYLTKYFTDYRQNYSWSWQYGYLEVVDYARENYAKYDKIIVTKKYGEPHEFFLFYWPWGPEKYRTDPNLVRFHQSNWYWVDRFDKFYFVNDWQIPKTGSTFVLESKSQVECAKSKCLLITSPGNYPAGWNKLYTIDFLDNKPAFEIYDN